MTIEAGTTMPLLTHHARRRAQQRAVRAEDIERLLDLGRTHYQNGGAIVYLDRRAVGWLSAQEARLARLYLVLSRGGGRIVTVGHRTRNLRLH